MSTPVFAICHLPLNTLFALKNIIVHKHCLPSPMERLKYPGETVKKRNKTKQNKGYAKFWGVNKEYYWGDVQMENSLQ